jgi:hypothetical protein
VITKVTEIDTDMDSDEDNIDDFKIPGEKMHDWGALLTRDDEEEEEEDDEDEDEIDDRLF